MKCAVTLKTGLARIYLDGLAAGDTAGWPPCHLGVRNKAHVFGVCVWHCSVVTPCMSGPSGTSRHGIGCLITGRDPLLLVVREPLTVNQLRLLLCPI